MPQAWRTEVEGVMSLIWVLHDICRYPVDPFTFLQYYAWMEGRAIIILLFYKRGYWFMKIRWMAISGWWLGVSD